MNKAIFLDRDGTVNIEKHYLYKIEDFEFIPGAVDAMRVLQNAGYKLIIITNQSGIGRGYYTERDFEILNNWMLEELVKLGVRINKVYYCPHHPNAKIEMYRKKCNCRKPALGLFFQAVKEFDLDLSKCFSVGDKARDCKICEQTECRGFLIENNGLKENIEVFKGGKEKKISYVSDLYEAAQIITHHNI